MLVTILLVAAALSFFLGAIKVEASVDWLHLGLMFVALAFAAERIL